jgi:acetylglutamate kinase
MSGSRIVVKVGGAVAVSAARSVLDLADRHQTCLVHGGGKRITEAMERAGIEVRFLGGRRVTTDEGIEIVRASLGAVNREICRALGPRALPLLGDEIGLQAVRLPKLGLVGHPVPTAPAAIVEALERGRIPVVAPLAVGPLNVNADEAAVALAIGLDAVRIVFLSDVPGVLLDGKVAQALHAEEVTRLLEDGAIVHGMVPKLRAAARAAANGIRAEIGETAVLA